MDETHDLRPKAGPIGALATPARPNVLTLATNHAHCRVLRTLLKSKIHRATITDANVNYEGSISIPTDLMKAADLLDGEKVLVTSISTGARLETYVIPGKSKSGEIVINGAAAHLINTGHIVTIMAWALSTKRVKPRRLLMDALNRIISNKVK